MDNNALTEHLFDITERLGQIQATGDATLKQATITNGRVTVHDADIAKMAKVLSLLHGEYERREAMNGLKSKDWRAFGLRWLERGIVALIASGIWLASENADLVKAFAGL